MWKLCLNIFLSIIILINCYVIDSDVIDTDKDVDKFNDSDYSVSVLMKHLKNLVAIQNKSVNPCENFYDYVCGNWETINPRPKGYKIYNVFKDIERKVSYKLKNFLLQSTADKDSDEGKARIYYLSCMKRTGIQSLLNFLNSIGGWPVLNENQNWNPDGDDLLEALLVNSSILEWSFINLYHSFDLKGSNYVFIIDEPSLGLNNPNYYLKENYAHIVEAYFKLITNCLELLGVSEALAKRTANEIITLERCLAEAMTDPAKPYLDDEHYYKTSVSKIMESYPSINWKRLMELFMHINITDDEPVVLNNVNYIKRVSEVLNQTDIQTIFNYVGWRSVQNILIKVDEKFESPFREFSEVLYDFNSYLPDWFRCLDETKSVFSLVLAKKFLKEYFDEQSKDDVMKIAETIRQEFLNIIEEADWIDDQTKKLSLKKVNHTRIEVGYPCGTLEVKEGVNRNLEVSENDYFSNYLAYRINDRKRYIEEETIDSEDSQFEENPINSWFDINPVTFDAFHVKNLNIIILPAGLLQPPFYHRDFHDAIKFGSVGFFIGHELTHGLDDAGRNFDFFGKMRKWWSNNSIEAFDQRTKCFINHFSNYTINGQPINGDLALGESIADIGGLMQAYRAFEKRIRNSNQELLDLEDEFKRLFFITYGQSWCHSSVSELFEAEYENHIPGAVRITGALKNIPEFSEAFDCPIGSYMNPEHKCKLW